LILSEITFDKKPFNNIMVHGMVLDIEKSKMSKSKGNIAAPQDAIAKFGRDYLRYYFAKFSKGEDFSYDESEFKEIRKFMTILTNTSNFINQLNKTKQITRIEDKWILSRYNTFLKEMTEAYNHYKFPEAIQIFESFVLELSRTYIKMIRDRANETLPVLNEMRIGLLKVIAPILPFTTENIWQTLSQKEESIHLSNWPNSDSKKINKKLESEMEATLKFIELGLAERDKAKIGLRWPLASARLVGPVDLSNETQEIVARQLNVKEIEFERKNISNQWVIKLNTKTTQELEAEGYARELSRKVQSERKLAGLKKGELITLNLYLSSRLEKMLKLLSEFIKDRTNSQEVNFKKGKPQTSFNIKTEKIGIEF